MSNLNFSFPVQSPWFKVLIFAVLTIHISCIKKNRKELEKKIIRGSSTSDLIREISSANLSVRSEIIAKNSFQVLEINGESENLFNKISLCSSMNENPSACRQIETIQSSYLISGFPEGPVNATVFKCHQEKRSWCSKPASLSFDYIAPKDKKLEKFVTNRILLGDAVGAVSKDIYQSVLEY